MFGPVSSQDEVNELAGEHGAHGGHSTDLFVKQQLWELVEHSKMSDVDKQVKKSELRSILRNWLIESNLLIVSAQEKYEVCIKDSLDIFSGLSFEQRKEILEMQQASW